MLSDAQATERPSVHIPVLLLKTRSVPHDAYEEYFANKPCFDPVFVPVLEHTRNESALDELGQLLKSRKLKERYGGMIFTSQRAVEAWTDTVLKVERDIGAHVNEDGEHNTSAFRIEARDTAVDGRTGAVFETDIMTATPFPLYVVGPATARALDTLLTTTALSARTASSSRSLPALSTLNPTIEGAHAGSGAVLAPYILSHYNALHQSTWLTWHDAPRLPFIPLLGMGSENYSRCRLESNDPRLRKRPLLFLVGETRRDIIPRTLRGGKPPVEVDEVEVYSTTVKHGFRTDVEAAVAHHTATTDPTIVVVVIFSPQGSRDLLLALNLIDNETDRPTTQAKTRWTTTTPSSPNESQRAESQPTYLIVTIGPTTRDHLIDKFGFEPDVCAQTPSPDGVGDGLLAFLRQKGFAVTVP